jgi:hypothetical protein
MKRTLTVLSAALFAGAVMVPAVQAQEAPPACSPTVVRLHHAAAAEAPAAEAPAAKASPAPMKQSHRMKRYHQKAASGERLGPRTPSG